MEHTKDDEDLIDAAEARELHELEEKERRKEREEAERYREEIEHRKEALNEKKGAILKDWIEGRASPEELKGIEEDLIGQVRAAAAERNRRGGIRPSEEKMAADKALGARLDRVQGRLAELEEARAKRAELKASAPTTPPVLPESFKTIDEVLASMPPPGERLKTGHETLDKHSRGGLARGRVYTVVGPPGKGKTAMLCQFSRVLAAQGAEVLMFPHDEGDWQAGMMLAEGLGFKRDVLENDYGSVKVAVAEKIAALKIRMAPPEATLSDAEGWLRGDGTSEALERIAALFGGTAGRDPATVPVIVIDSVQTVRANRREKPKNRKEWADAVMAMARKLAGLGAIVLLASKANRSSWAKKKEIDRTDVLSSGLDSSEIEYHSDALWFIDGDIERSFLTLAKNRPGDAGHIIPMRFDKDRASFKEIDAAVAMEQRDDARDRARLKASEAAQKRLESAFEKLRRGKLKTGPNEEPESSRNEIAREAGLNTTRQDCMDAFAALEAQKMLEPVHRRKGKFYRRGPNYPA